MGRKRNDNMFRKRKPWVDGKPGPTYRDCQMCWSRPAVGTMTSGLSGNGEVHVCEQCADPDLFTPYDDAQGRDI